MNSDQSPELSDCDRAMHIQTDHGVLLKVNIFKLIINLISFRLESQSLFDSVNRAVRAWKKKPKEQFHDELSCDCSFNQE